MINGINVFKTSKSVLLNFEFKYFKKERYPTASFGVTMVAGYLFLNQFNRLNLVARLTRASI